MRIISLPLPALAFIVATRAALGAGLGLLLASRLRPQPRRALGLTLATLGAVTTIPALLIVKDNARDTTGTAIERDFRLVKPVQV